MRFINVTGEEIVYFKTDGSKEIIPPIGELKAEKVLYSKEEKTVSLSAIICMKAKRFLKKSGRLL